MNRSIKTSTCRTGEQRVEVLRFLEDRDAQHACLRPGVASPHHLPGLRAAGKDDRSGDRECQRASHAIAVR